MPLNWKALSGLLMFASTIGFPTIAAAQIETSNYQTPNQVYRLDTWTWFLVQEFFS